MGYAARSACERDGTKGVVAGVATVLAVRLGKVAVGERASTRWGREGLRVGEASVEYGVIRPAAAQVEADEADETHEADEASEADALDDLADEIAMLSAHISAATYRLLILIARFDERGGWEPGGFRSCADWLAFRTGVCKGAAREKVRTARALVALPKTGAAMGRGELSFAKVRAITRVATPENEEALIELAHATTAEELERVIRSWRRHDRATEAEIERALHRSRRLVIRPDGEGMYEVRGRLDPEVGALLMRAIEAGSDALWRAATDPYDTSAEQRRADAIALLAERALAVGFGRGRVEDDGAAEGEEEVEAEDVSAETSRAETAESRRPAPFSGSRAERYQVLLLVEPATLEAEGEPGRSELEDGTRVSAETARRLACDVSVVEVTSVPVPDGRAQLGVGEVLDIGRRTRTIPPALRRALDVRDRGCRFPGCGLRFTDGHHIRHWQDGGPTALHNLVSLCAFHHRLVHEEGFRVDLPPGGRPNFYTPSGTPLPEVPPPGLPEPGPAGARAAGARGDRARRGPLGRCRDTPLTGAAARRSAATDATPPRCPTALGHRPGTLPERA